MTIEELIKELSKYPPELNVYLHKGGFKYNWSCELIEDDDINIDGCITLSGGD